MGKRLLLAGSILLLATLASVLWQQLSRSGSQAALPSPAAPVKGKPAGAPPARAHAHPLDPLSKEEIAAVVKILEDEGKLGKDCFFAHLVLNEPAKEEILAFKPSAPMRREAFAVLYDRAANNTYEAVVDLPAGKMLSWKHRPGAQPVQLEEETPAATALVHRDLRWKKALERRGIKDPQKEVECDVLLPGSSLFVPNPDGARLMRVAPYYRGTGNNSFGRPIEGVSALVNLTTGEVLEVTDDKDLIPVAGAESDFFDTRAIGTLREGCRPLTVAQPKGASFEIRGQEIRWQKWRFRYALDPREGLLLYTVGYEDDDKVRSILYRASLAEMAVPYADPSPNWVWRSPFDVGEYGLGRLSHTLHAGQEVPEYATLLDVVYADDRGAARVKPAAVAIWEQDSGILWMHHDDLSGRTETRRARQLVLFSMFTLGNYDYGVQWIFQQDGVLEVKVELDGIVLAKGVASQECQVCRQKPDAEGKAIPTGTDRYGTLMAPNIVGVNHQHFFCFRLDFDVDGTANSLYELNVRPVSESRGYRLQNTFAVEQTLLRREEEARRNLCLETHRHWKVINPNTAGKLGHRPGYVLEPGTNSVPYCHPESDQRRRAGFVTHHLWATRYRRGEIYPAGDYPSQSPGGEGLPRWSGGESIENQDLVLWYTVGVTHAPRVEDWPVMPAARAGFRLVPHGFFSRNPALDVPGAPERR